MITLCITKANGFVYDEEFDTVCDARKCTQYLPKGWSWVIRKDGEYVTHGKQ